MYFRNAAISIIERLICNVDPDIRQHTHWLPVLHVEQLDTPAYLNAVLDFCQGYSELTDRRVMATVMTPQSPLITSRLGENGIAPEDYWNHIDQVAKVADIGLHGHFLRDNDWPQHLGAFDLAAIRKQIIDEVSVLESRGLLADTPLTYSAGWWFMVPALQQLLLELDFSLDFSLSVSKENYSASGHIARQTAKLGDTVLYTNHGKTLAGPFALASINQSGSQSIGLFKHGAHRWRDKRSRYISLYSHDYDLNVQAALASVRHLKEMEFSFCNAAEIAT